MSAKLSEITKALPPHCKILAVSKLQSPEQIETLAKSGQKAFAENYVQEALSKQQLFAEKGLALDWHFIGHLQTNKAKSVAGKFSLIHSVDSLRLAEALNNFVPEGKVQRILLQVNVADEASKTGFKTVEVSSALETISKLAKLNAVGLMTMPPLFEDPEQARPFFRQLHDLQQKLKKKYPMLLELSMGTSSDYRVAAEEGATWVRLGTIIFGARPQKSVL